MAEKSTFDYVNEILGIANYVRDVLRPAYTTEAARAASRTATPSAPTGSSTRLTCGAGAILSTHYGPARSTVDRASIASSRAAA